MKLNLHPKEFLALYNFLHANLQSISTTDPDHASLCEVKNRMRSYAISALLKKENDLPDDVLFRNWENNQKAKIENLEKMNKEISSKNMFAFDDYEETEVNTKNPPAPKVPKIGKFSARLFVVLQLM
jgi:hypothetical protein